MPAKASGEIKTRIVHQLQKNGDTYIIERRTLYDPVKKYNRVLLNWLRSFDTNERWLAKAHA
jgi:hypothetical protein